MNPGILRLCELPQVFLQKKDLTPESVEKVADTARYSMSRDQYQDPEEVVRRCIIAQLAEQYVADHMEGWVNHGVEDANDPYTYAYDVLAPVKYCALRIEVKTHQSESKYVTVSTSESGAYPTNGTKGINIGPFLENNVADLILFIDVTSINGGWLFTPLVVCGKEGLQHMIRPSKFSGYYLTTMCSSHKDLYKYQFTN